MLLMCVCASFAQRSVDLEVTMITPEDGSYTPSMQTFPLEISVANVGAENFNADDSLAYYMLINGDTVQTAPGQAQSAIYTGFAILPGQSHAIIRQMAFNSSFDGMEIDLCIFVKPHNNAHPIEDPSLINNTGCSTVTVMESPTAGLDEAGQGGLLLFPNPAKSFVAIESSLEILSVAVHDSAGKRIALPDLQGTAIDCSGLENGLYFVSVETSAGTGMRRLLISK